MAGEKHHIQYVPEPPSVSMTFVGWSALAGLLLVAVAIGVFYGVYRAAVPTTNYPGAATFPQPRVDTQEREELHRIRAAQQLVHGVGAGADDEHLFRGRPRREPGLRDTDPRARCGRGHEAHVHGRGCYTPASR